MTVHFTAFDMYCPSHDLYPKVDFDVCDWSLLCQVLVVTVRICSMTSTANRVFLARSCYTLNDAFAT